MIRKLLVANRGEIAVRIIRACRELGIESVAVYSEADKDSLHAQLADQAVCIGPGPSTESYLNMESIISATMTTGEMPYIQALGFYLKMPVSHKYVKSAALSLWGLPLL